MPTTENKNRIDEAAAIEVVDWFRTRPDSVKALMLRFPPMCSVHGVRPLVSPRAVGVVVSWTEDGQVSVVEPGNPIRGFCDPAWLEVVGYEPGMRPEDIRNILDARWAP